MSIQLVKFENPLYIPSAFGNIMGTGEYDVFRFHDDCVYDADKSYNTYKITANGKSFVLKKYEYPEDYESEVRQYSLLHGLPVPNLLCAADGCILMDYVEGDDMKNATDDGVSAAAQSLAEVMNAYPMGRDYEMGRYDTYIKRLERRASCLKNEPEIERAFGVFLQRQRTIPLTLSNADLLPINVLFDGRRAVIIDWSFGGFMPYALDIARFFAHTTPNGEVTSFRMSDYQKKLFVELVYDGLEIKPDRKIFDRDILLAELNELVEILEYYFNDPHAERGNVFELYYHAAKRLASVILSSL